MDDEQNKHNLLNSELVGVERAYKRDVAVTTARPIFKIIGFFVWALFDIGLLTLFLFVVVGYLVFGQFTDRKQAALIYNNIISASNTIASHSASNLLVSDVYVFSLGEGEYDYVATVQNNNSDWYAQYTYSFVTSEGSTQSTHGFALPGDSRPIMSLRQSIGDRDARIELTDIVWKRVDAHEIDDTEAWLDDHNDFTISEARHEKNLEVGEMKIARSSFNVQNNTSNNFWSAEFLVLLTRNGELVGVNKVTIPGFEVGETRSVAVNWFGSTVSSAEVEIYSNINFFDDRVYMDQLTNDNKVDIRDPVLN